MPTFDYNIIRRICTVTHFVVERSVSHFDSAAHYRVPGLVPVSATSQPTLYMVAEQ